MKKKHNLQPIGRKIKIKRIILDLTQKQLAEKVGCVPSAVSQWENGNKCPSYFLAKELERTLGINLEEEYAWIS